MTCGDTNVFIFGVAFRSWMQKNPKKSGTQGPLKVRKILCSSVFWQLGIIFLIVIV